MNSQSFVYAADSIRVQAGGQSIFDKLGQALTAGTAGAVVSGWAGLYNTGAWYLNTLTPATIEEIDTTKVLKSLDRDWAKYYEEHQGVLDTLGFIGGAFVPGGAALRGLRLLRAGTSAGAFGKILGYTATKQKEHLEAGLKQIAETGPSVFTSLNRNRALAITWGAADQMVQAAVFETAALAALHQSNIFKDESAKDILWDLSVAAAFGGVIGGAVSAFFTNRIFKDAGKVVDSKLRDLDVVRALDTIGLSFGDEAFSVIDSVLDLGKKTQNIAHPTVTFEYIFDGKPLTKTFDFLLAGSKKTENVRTGLQALEKKLTSVVGDDATVGSSLAKHLLRIFDEGKRANKSDEDIRLAMGQLLFNLVKVRGLSPNLREASREVWYLADVLPEDAAENVFKAISYSRTSADQKAYRLVGNWTDVKSAILGLQVHKLKDAWKNGYDFAINPKTKQVSINPNSKRIIALEKEENPYLQVILNPRTGELYDNATPVIADLATATNPLIIRDSFVSAGSRSFLMSPSNYEKSKDSLYYSARHVWASTYRGKIDAVHEFDFSLLESPHFRALAGKKQAELTILREDGSTLVLNNFAELDAFIFSQKLRLAKEWQNTFLSPEELAIALNVEKKWLDNAVAAEFNPDKLYDPKLHSRPLDSYKERENLVLLYDRAAMEAAKEFPDAITAYHERVHLARTNAHNAAATVLGEHYALFPEELLGRGNADSVGTGPTGFGFSNPDYNDPLRVWAQSAGVGTHLASQRIVKEAHDAIQPASAAVLTENNLELGAVLTAYRRSPERLYFDQQNKRIVDLASWKKLKEEAVLAPDTEFKTVIPIEKQSTLDFLRDFQKGHQTWFDKYTVLAAARGHTLSWDREALYLPPIDTRSTPYFAFVRHIDGKINTASSEVSMITARSKQELQELVNSIVSDPQFRDKVQVLFKRDTAEYYKAKMAYEYSSGLHDPQIDSYLRRAGRLGDFKPTLTPQAVINDFVEYIRRRETSLIRQAVRTNYAQTFAELDWLSAQYTAAAKSRFSFLGRLEQSKIKDPFGDYERLALNISKKDEYVVWKQVNDFVDSLGTAAYRAAESVFKDAKQGALSWEEANRVMERVGLQGPFSSQQDFIAAQFGSGEGNLAKAFVAKANLFMVNVGLRLDTAQAIINAISTPILLGAEVSAIRNSLKNNPEFLAKFDEAFQVTHPDGYKIPSMWKLLATAVRNYFGPDKQLLLRRYLDIGTVREPLLQHHSMLEDLSLLPNMNVSKWMNAVDKAVESGAKLTGNNFVEEFTRFVASDVMRQITEPLRKAGLMSMKEQNAFMQIFTNRVQGNYIASQRPIAFQGTVGAALGLFQTYQFTLFQQLFKHIENRDYRTVAILGALQTSLYGFHGLPLFDAINTHLIGTANMNEGHHDAYSVVPQMIGKELGDFFMYGAASALPIFSERAPALFTRGDLNPRHITILPNPMNPTEIPIFSMGARLFNAAVSVGKQVVDGVDLSTAFLHGLQHQGISRPLAGLATALTGAATTSKGSLLAAHNDIFSLTTAVRLIGAKPMNEALAADHFFRLNAYRAYDRERIERLGTSIKQKLRTGTFTEEDALEFMSRYAASGGRIENYTQALQRWFERATQSEINKLSRAHQSVYGRRLLEVMGADSLPE